MSDDGRPPKRRKSVAQFVLGIVGLGARDEQPPSHPSSAPAPAAAPKTTTRAPSRRGTPAGNNSSTGTGASREPPPAAGIPAQNRRSKQTLPGAAHSALRALGGDDAPDAAAPGIAEAAKKGKGRRSPETREEEEEEDEGDDKKGVTRKGKGKARRKRRAAVKTEGAGVVMEPIDLDEWTEVEALASIRYNNKPLMGMLVAELRDALIELGLDHVGKQADLRMRLARRLYAELADGTAGAGSMNGFGFPGSGAEQCEKISARDCRHKKRRTSMALTSLRKGPETKDSPIIISSSDDEAEKAAAAAEATAHTTESPAAGTTTSAPGSQPARRGKRTRAMRDKSSPAEVEKPNPATAAEAVAAGPQPGMTMAELRKGVKALGLKPKGTRKADLEACWRDAVSGATEEEKQEEEAERGQKSEDQDTSMIGGDVQASVEGIRVADMRVAALKKHVERMGLKPSGHLKADLQHCLCEALRGGHSGKGKHSKRTVGGAAAKTKGKQSASPSVAATARPGRAGRGRSASRANQPVASSVSPAERVGTAQAGSATSAGEGLSPDHVVFHGTVVSDMTPETMRESLHDLDVAFLRKDDDEVVHDLVDALLLRKAEAAETVANKQAWRGRLVSKMRKAELENTLRRLDANHSGKVEELRSRIRKVLRSWADTEIVILDAGDAGRGSTAGGGAGAGSPARSTRRAKAGAGLKIDVDSTDDEVHVGKSSAIKAASTSKGRARPVQQTPVEDTAVSLRPRGRRVARASTAVEVDNASRTSARPRAKSGRRLPADKREEEEEETIEVSPKRPTTGRATGKGKAKASKSGSTSPGRTKTVVSKTGLARSRSGTKHAGSGGKEGGNVDEGDSGDDKNDEGRSSTLGTSRRHVGRTPRPGSKKKDVASAPTGKDKGKGKASTRVTQPPDLSSSPQTAAGSRLDDTQAEGFSEDETLTRDGDSAVAAVAAAISSQRGETNHASSSPKIAKDESDESDSTRGNNHRGAVPRLSGADSPILSPPDSPRQSSPQEASAEEGEGSPGSPGAARSSSGSQTQSEENAGDASGGERGSDGDINGDGDGDDDILPPPGSPRQYFPQEASPEEGEGPPGSPGATRSSSGSQTQSEENAGGASGGEQGSDGDGNGDGDDDAKDERAGGNGYAGDAAGAGGDGGGDGDGDGDGSSSGSVEENAGDNKGEDEKDDDQESVGEDEIENAEVAQEGQAIAGDGQEDTIYSQSLPAAADTSQLLAAADGEAMEVSTAVPSPEDSVKTPQIAGNDRQDDAGASETMDIDCEEDEEGIGGVVVEPKLAETGDAAVAADEPTPALESEGGEANAAEDLLQYMRDEGLAAQETFEHLDVSADQGSPGASGTAAGSMESGAEAEFDEEEEGDTVEETEAADEEEGAEAQREGGAVAQGSPAGNATFGERVDEVAEDRESAGEFVNDEDGNGGYPDGEQNDGEMEMYQEEAIPAAVNEVDADGDQVSTDVENQDNDAASGSRSGDEDGDDDAAGAPEGFEQGALVDGSGQEEDQVEDEDGGVALADRLDGRYGVEDEGDVGRVEIESDQEEGGGGGYEEEEEEHEGDGEENEYDDDDAGYGEEEDNYDEEEGEEGGAGEEVGGGAVGDTGEAAIEIGDSSDEADDDAPAGGDAGDEEEEHTTNDVSNTSPQVGTAAAAAAVPPDTADDRLEIDDTVEDSAVDDAEGSGDTIGDEQDASSSDDPPDVVTNGLVDGSAETEGEEAMDVEQDPPENSSVAAAADADAAAAGALADARVGAAHAEEEFQPPSEVSRARIETPPSSPSAPGDSPDTSSVADPRGGMREFKTLFGEMDYAGKRAAINFLADPTVRPVDPSLPVLTAEQDARLRTAARSPSDWDHDLILSLNPFVDAARDVLRGEAQGTLDAGWGSAPNPDWPSVREVIPAMRRKVLPSGTQRPALRPPPTTQGTAGSAFSALPSYRADGGDSKWTFANRASNDDSDQAAMRQRVDKVGRGAAGERPPVPSFGAPPTSPATPRNPGVSPPLAVTAARTPALGPRPGGAGSLAAREPSSDRRRSSGSVLRYRSRDFTPRRRPRASLMGELGYGAGTLGEWLGAVGGPGVSDAAGGNSSNDTGGQGRGHDGSYVGLEHREGAARRRAEGRVATPAAPAGSTQGYAGDDAPVSGNYSGSSLGLEGMDATRLRRTAEEADKMASRVAAERKATTEIGNIIMSVVSQQDNAAVVKRNVREEHGLRSGIQDEQDRAKGKAKHAAEEQGSRQGGQEPERMLTTSFGSPAPPSLAPLAAAAVEEEWEFVFRTKPAAARLQQLSGDVVMREGDALSGTSSGISDAEFAFATGRPRPPPTRRAQPFSFPRTTPAKRSCPSRDETGGVLALSGGGVARWEGATAGGRFTFLRGTQSVPNHGRRTRGSRGAEYTPTVSAAMAPLAVAGASPSASGSGGGTGAAGTGAGTGASRAPITNGFDMAMFRKPGEWKCAACLVMNPKDATQCLSCETPKPGGDGAGGASGAGSGKSGSTAAPGRLLAGLSCSSSTPKFTFGGQPSGDMPKAGSGGSAPGSSTEAAGAFSFRVQGSAPPAPAPAPAPATGGFDMSKFTTPGEWKCEFCLVRNPPDKTKCLSCEAPRAEAGSAAAPPGGPLGVANGSSLGGRLFAGGAPAGKTAFTFGQQQPAATSSGSATAALSGASPFTFGSGAGASVGVSSTSAGTANPGLFRFGAQTGEVVEGKGASSTVVPAAATEPSAAPTPVTGGFDMSRDSPKPPTGGGRGGVEAAASSSTPSASLGRFGPGLLGAGGGASSSSASRPSGGFHFGAPAGGDAPAPSQPSSTATSAASPSPSAAGASGGGGFTFASPSPAPLVVFPRHPAPEGAAPATGGGFGFSAIGGNAPAAAAIAGGFGTSTPDFGGSSNNSSAAGPNPSVVRDAGASSIATRPDIVASGSVGSTSAPARSFGPFGSAGPFDAPPDGGTSSGAVFGLSGPPPRGGPFGGQPSAGSPASGASFSARSVPSGFGASSGGGFFAPPATAGTTAHADVTSGLFGGTSNPPAPAGISSAETPASAAGGSSLFGGPPAAGAPPASVTSGNSSSSRTAASALFNFGTGSLPAPANLTPGGNAAGPLFTFGAGGSTPSVGAPPAPAPIPGFVFGPDVGGGATNGSGSAPAPAPPSSGGFGLFNISPPNNP